MPDRKTAVIGLGIFGREVALSLAGRGFPVVAIDSDPDQIQRVKDRVAQALIMDTTSERALLDAKIDKMSTVVNAIGTGHLQNSILTTALLSQLGVERIVARATTPLHERILRQVGATEVVNPEREMGRKVAQQIARPGLLDVLPLSEGACVAEVPVPPSFVGHTLAELDVRRRYNVNVVGVQRVRLADQVVSQTADDTESVESMIEENRRMILNISPTQDTFLENDVLVAIGREQDINRLAGLG